MRKIVSTVIVLMFFLTATFAQERVVKGKVTDEKGNPIALATVKVKGTKKVTLTDGEGNFSLKLNGAQTVTITAVDADIKELAISPDQESVSISIKQKAKDLNDVVVTSVLGIQRRVKELGTSSTLVKGADLTKSTPINLQNGLTGKVTGLTIQTINNGVLADTRINLRGIRSLTGNNNPLLVLDGVPMNLSYLNSINPNDINEVNVLKSANATSIYGPEGANGALIITTKRGSRLKPIISVSQSVQFEKVSFLPKLQTEFGAGGAYSLGSGSTSYDHYIHIPYENESFGPAYDGSTVQIGRDAPDGSQYKIPYKALKNEKWKFWNTGVTSQSTVSFSTGDFYLSAQDVDIAGIMPKDKNHRTVLRLSANKEYNSFKASFSLAYTQSHYDIASGAPNGSPYFYVLNTPMEIPLTKFKNWKNDYWSSPNGYFNDYYENPYFIIDNYRLTDKKNDFLGNIQLDYKVNNWLNLTYRIGGTITSESQRSSQSEYTYSDFAKQYKYLAKSGDVKAAVSDASSLSNRITSEIFATVTKSVKKFNFTGVFGESYREVYSNTTSLSASQLASNNVTNVSYRTGEASISQGYTKYIADRYFAKFNIGFDNWAFLEINTSNDRDSRLYNSYKPSASQYSNFYPGVNASVILSDAIPSIKKLDYISFLKVRGGLSRTANTNLSGPYQLQNTYTLGNQFPYSQLPGYTASGQYNSPTLNAEQVVEKEVGLEIGLLKNKVNVEAVYYNQNNTRQIINASASSATGYSSYRINGAEFINQGFELDLKLNPLIKSRDFTANVKFGYNYQINKVTKVVDRNDEIGLGNLSYVIKGKPAYTFKMTDYLRDSKGHVIVDSTTGYPTRDPNNRTFGKTLPDNFFNFNADFSYKQFTLSFTIDYRGGNQVYSDLGPTLDFSGISERSATNHRRPFVFPNSVVADPKGVFVDASGNHYSTNKSILIQAPTSNFWSQDINIRTRSNYLSSGAFWKLREVSLSYDVPTKYLNKLYVKKAAISLTGRNLLMFLPKTNDWTDPEFSNTTGNAQGVNTTDIPPPTRIFGFNINLQF